MNEETLTLLLHYNQKLSDNYEDLESLLSDPTKKGERTIRKRLRQNKKICRRMVELTDRTRKS